MEEATKAWKVDHFARPHGIVTAKVDAYSGWRPARTPRKTVSELFIDGTQPKQPDNTQGRHPGRAGRPTPCGRTAASAPRSRRASWTSAMSSPSMSSWQAADRAWAARAARGRRASWAAQGRSRRARAYFYNGAFRPFGSTWGAPFPTDQDLFHASRRARRRAGSPADRRRSRRRPSRGGGRGSCRSPPDQRLTDARPVAAFATVAGSPLPHERVAAERRSHGVAQRARAVAVDDRDALRAGHGRLVQVAVERLERLVDPGAAQVEGRGHDAVRGRRTPHRRSRGRRSRLGAELAPPAGAGAVPGASPGADGAPTASAAMGSRSSSATVDAQLAGLERAATAGQVDRQPGGPPNPRAGCARSCPAAQSGRRRGRTSGTGGLRRRGAGTASTRASRAASSCRVALR